MQIRYEITYKSMYLFLYNMNLIFIWQVTLPRLNYIKFKILDMYNRAVLKVMGVLVGVPLKISKQIQEALYPCEPEEPEEDPKKKQ